MKTFAIGMLSLCAFAGVISATPVGYTATVVNAGTTKVIDNDGYLVGPYTLKVNGTNYAALCVDFQDNATLGAAYSAYETQLSSNSLANTYHPTFSTQYKQEAYLMSLILQPNADRIDIQDAAWFLTDSSYKASKNAMNYVSLSAANYTSVDFSKFYIVSGTDRENWKRPQEFLITADVASPEPATVMMMGGGLLVAGLARRRKAPKIIA